jgi:hypothetical protein
MQQLSKLQLAEAANNQAERLRVSLGTSRLQLAERSAASDQRLECSDVKTTDIYRQATKRTFADIRGN